MVRPDSMSRSMASERSYSRRSAGWTSSRPSTGISPGDDARSKSIPRSLRTLSPSIGPDALEPTRYGLAVSVEPIQEPLKILHPSLLTDCSERSGREVVVIWHRHRSRRGIVVVGRFPPKNVMVAADPIDVEWSVVDQDFANVFTGVPSATLSILAGYSSSSGSDASETFLSGSMPASRSSASVGVRPSP